MNQAYELEVTRCYFKQRLLILRLASFLSISFVLFSLPNVNDVDVILSKAEDLFFNYCRKSTVDCFQLIDEPVEKKANRKQRFPFDF